MSNKKSFGKLHKSTKLFLSAFGFVLLSVNTSPLHAKDCPTLSIEERYKKSDMVFSGKVVEIEPLTYENYAPNPPALSNYVGIKVNKIWKYDFRLRGEIFGLGERYVSRKISAFKIGDEYIFFLSEKKDFNPDKGWIIDECSNFENVNQSSKLISDLDLLNKDQ